MDTETIESYITAYIETIPALRKKKTLEILEKDKISMSLRMMDSIDDIVKIQKDAIDNWYCVHHLKTKDSPARMSDIVFFNVCKTTAKFVSFISGVDIDHE